MKWNWGTGIAATYTLFVIFMIFMVVRSTSYDHSLVTENYYQKDLEYQSHFEKLKNANALANDLEIRYESKNDELIFAFPELFKEIRGEVLFFRPSDKNQDFRLEIGNSTEKNLTVKTGKMSRGFWKIKVDWQGDGQLFFKEQELIL